MKLSLWYFFKAEILVKTRKVSCMCPTFKSMFQSCYDRVCNIGISEELPTIEVCVFLKKTFLILLITMSWNKYTVHIISMYNFMDQIYWFWVWFWLWDSMILYIWKVLFYFVWKWIFIANGVPTLVYPKYCTSTSLQINQNS